MKNLTTAQAILIGLTLIAFAIASIPFSSGIVKDAHASSVKKIAICDKTGTRCANTNIGSFLVRVVNQ